MAKVVFIIWQRKKGLHLNHFLVTLTPPTCLGTHYPIPSRPVCPSTWPTCCLGEEILLAQDKDSLRSVAWPPLLEGPCSLAPGLCALPFSSTSRFLRLENCCCRALLSCSLCWVLCAFPTWRQVVTLGRQRRLSRVSCRRSHLAS